VVKDVGGTVSAVAVGVREDSVAMMRGVHDAMASGVGSVKAAAEAAFSPISKAISDYARKAIATAHDLPGNIASALRDQSKQVDDAGKQLAEDMTKEIDNAVRLAYLKSLLVGKEMTRGLADSRPVVRAEAMAWRDAILTEITSIQTGAQMIAVNAGVNLAAGLQMALVPVAAAAAGLRLRATKELQFDGAPIGWGVGIAYVNGLNAALAHGLTGQTYSYIQKYTKLLKMAGSPDYTHAIEAGVGVAKGWLGGVNKTLGQGKLNLPSLSGGSGGSGRGAPTTGGGGGTVININIPHDSFIDGASVDRLAIVIATRLRFAPGS
jgi:hypothetical protein